MREFVKKKNELQVSGTALGLCQPLTAGDSRGNIHRGEYAKGSLAHRHDLPQQHAERPHVASARVDAIANAFDRHPLPRLGICRLLAIVVSRLGNRSCLQVIDFSVLSRMRKREAHQSKVTKFDDSE